MAHTPNTVRYGRREGMTEVIAAMPAATLTATVRT